MLQRTTNLLKRSMACAALSAFALLLIPISSHTDGAAGKLLSFLVALTFWGGLILEQMFFWKANEESRKLVQKTNRSKQWDRSLIGLLTFASSKEARIMDVIFLVSLIVSAALYLLKAESSLLVMVSLAGLYLSFNLHCILNGRTYRFIKSLHAAKKSRK